ncbi:MAG: Flp family type IVb pilin [Actinomycetota bacterium]
MLLAVYVWATSRATETLDQRGVTAAEYALLIALIAVAVVTAVGLLGDAVLGAITDITTGIND